MFIVRISIFMACISSLLASADILPTAEGIYRCGDTYISGIDYIQNPRAGCVTVKTKERVIYPLVADTTTKPAPIEPSPKSFAEEKESPTTYQSIGRQSSMSTSSSKIERLIISTLLAIFLLLAAGKLLKPNGAHRKVSSGLKMWAGYAFSFLTLFTLLLAFYTVLNFPSGLFQATINIGGAAIGDLVAQIVGTFLPAVAFGAIAYRLLVVKISSGE